MAVLEIYLEILINFFEILYPPLKINFKQLKELFAINYTYFSDIDYTCKHV